MTQPSAQCDLPIEFREYAHEEDYGCVSWSWVHSYRASPWARLMHPSTYARTQRTIAENLISLVRITSPGPRLVVATADGDLHTILGWACGELHRRRTILHYVWVKQPFRRQGLAAALVAEFKRRYEADPAAPVVVSHASDAAYRAVRASAAARVAVGSLTEPALRFNPMLAVNPNFEVAL